ncbi:hypothetical protein J6590_066314 [Homalodisca vitripennis]|nr:hypothetical protein J6590_066314 [Homalodisca vitripennis]
MVAAGAPLRLGAHKRRYRCARAAPGQHPASRRSNSSEAVVWRLERMADFKIRHTLFFCIRLKSTGMALNGFLLMLTCEGEVFFATHTIESYLGFHQRKPIRPESLQYASGRNVVSRDEPEPERGQRPLQRRSPQCLCVVRYKYYKLLECKQESGREPRPSHEL